MEGVDQRLHGRRIFLDEILLDVEHGRRIRAAENRPRPLLRSAVRDDLDVTILLELGDHGIKIGERVDVAFLYRRDGGGTDADPDIGRVGRLQPRLRHQVHHEEIGG